MIERMVWNFVAAFVLRQIEKFKKSIDWEKVKADIAERVKKLVPGTWFDAEAAEAVTYIIDTLQLALSSDQIEAILNLTVAQKYDEAGQVLKEVLVCAWSKECQVPKARTMVLV